MAVPAARPSSPPRRPADGAERAVAAERAFIALAEAVAADRTRREVLDLVARAAAGLPGEATVQLWLVDEAGHRLELAASHGTRPGRRGVPQPRTLGIHEGLAGAVAQSRAPLVLASLSGEPRVAAREWLRDQGLASFAGVPMVRADRLLGVLCLFTRRRRRFTPRAVSVLRSFAAYAAVAIENAALSDTATARLRRLETLREIERELSQQHDPDALLGLIVRRASELLRADSATVYVLDEASQLLRARASHDTGDWIRDVTIPFGQGVTGAVAARRAGMIVNDYGRSPHAIPPFVGKDAAILAQPLLHDGTLQGVIVVRRATVDQPFGETDLVQLGDFAVQASIALENARLLRLASVQAERIKVAAEIGQALAATRDTDRIVDLIAERCRETLGAEAFGLFRFDGSGRLRYECGVGLPEAFMRVHRLALGEGVVGRAAAERRAVETVDILHDPAVSLSPDARALIEGAGSRAIAAVPILAGGNVLGVLALYHPVGFQIPREEAEFLQILADHAAAALDNARLFTESRRRQESAETLASITQTLTGSLDLQTLITQVADAIQRLLGCDGAAIGLVAADGVVRLSARTGTGAEAFREVVVRPGEGVTSWVLQHGEPFFTTDYEHDPRISPAFARGVRAAGIASILSVPVRLGDETVGVLHAFYEAVVPMAADDVARATDLARVVAVAVANARLFEEAHAHEAAATRAYQDLKAAQDQLVRAEKLRALGEMASGVAHDFNNVLAAILGRVQLILRRVEDPTLRQWLSIIERAALDGAKIVRQLQEFTHIRRDRPTQTVDVNAVVEDAVEMTRTRWRDDTQSRGVDVRLVVELTPGPPVDGHPAELGEALMNLILNAVDALPEGGTITAATRPASDGGVLVSVADTGVGMSEAVRGRIFEPFFTTKGLRGTGLGLAMVYGIVSRHGGEVTVESTEGAGSTFTIHLPPGRLRSTEVSWPPALRSEGTARVLVIDDEPHVREILAEILRVQKHEVVEAALGVEGLIRFRERSFDLVMTDLAMPGMSGWQVAQAIKAERPEVPVVLVTGWGVEVPPDQLRQNGVDRVMTKPFRFEDVRDVVASFRPKG